jgi:hypothetical protein
VTTTSHLRFRVYIHRARLDLARSRFFFEAGDYGLASSFLGLARAHRRTAFGFLKGAQS